MAKEFFTVGEVIETFQIKESFLVELEEEEILCPTCKATPPEKLYPSGELEKLRLAKLLYEDMGVNVPGIEVILQMRQNMLDMRRQFDIIMENLVNDLKKALRNGS